MDAPQTRSIASRSSPERGRNTMERRSRAGLIAGVVVVALVGCAGEGAEENASAAVETKIGAKVEKKSEALRIEVNSNSIAYDYFPSLNVPHGIAGDEQFVFVTQPLSGRVSVVNRLTGEELTTLPPPPIGWQLPFTL